MDLQAVGAASISMNMARTQQAVDISVTKKAMDFQETQATQLIQQMQNAAPSFGHALDTRA